MVLVFVVSSCVEWEVYGHHLEVDHGYLGFMLPKAKALKLTLYPNLPHPYLSLTLQALKTFRPLCIESY